MVLFPLLHFRLFCAKYNTQMDAKETHSPAKISGLFRFFCSVYPFCIHFCAILRMKKQIQPQPDLTGPGAVLAVLLPGKLSGLF